MAVRSTTLVSIRPLNVLMTSQTTGRVFIFQSLRHVLTILCMEAKGLGATFSQRNWEESE